MSYSFYFRFHRYDERSGRSGTSIETKFTRQLLLVQEEPVLEFIDLDEGGVRRQTENASDLLLSVVVVQPFAAKYPALGRAHAPFLAVRIVRGLADRIICHDIED